MNYWLTSHWPPESNEEAKFEVWLQDKHFRTASKVTPGDKVVVVQTKNGRLRRDPLTGQIFDRQRGAGGVVAIVEILEPCSPSGMEPEFYDDGTTRTWAFRAPTKEIASGYIIHYEPLCAILKKGSYAHLGAGPYHGMESIRKEEFEAIYNIYLKKGLAKHSDSVPVITKYPHGEGIDHKRLKLFVRDNPSQIFPGKKFRSCKDEFPFKLTGDRIDVLLVEENGTSYAIEIEVDVMEDGLAGVLQAIKYKHMYAALTECEYTNVKGVLVAHSISQSITEICRRYDILSIEVPRGKVKY